MACSQTWLGLLDTLGLKWVCLKFGRNAISICRYGGIFIVILVCLWHILDFEWNAGCVQVGPEEQDMYEKFWELNEYVAGSYDQRRDFELLNQEISKKEKTLSANRLFYLALPPSVFEPVTANIRNTCMGTR